MKPAVAGLSHRAGKSRLLIFTDEGSHQAGRLADCGDISSTDDLA
jgi:hypothetical protein